MQKRPSDTSKEKDATPEIQEIADKLKSQVESRLNRTFSTFKAVKFTQQVIAEMQYLIKIKVGDNEYVHIHAIRAPKESAGVVLEDAKGDRTEDDALYMNKVTSPKGARPIDLTAV